MKKSILVILCLFLTILDFQVFAEGNSREVDCKTYTVTVDGYDYIGTSVKYGDSYIIVPVYSDNAVFEGYYTEPGGKGTPLTDKYGNSLDAYTFEEDITVYPYLKHVFLNKVAITGDVKATVGDNLTLSINFGTDKDVSSINVKVKHPAGWNIKEVANVDFAQATLVETVTEGQWSVTEFNCVYSANGEYVLKDTLYNPFNIVFEVTNSCPAGIYTISAVDGSYMAGEEAYGFEEFKEKKVRILSRPVDEIIVSGPQFIEKATQYTATVLPAYASKIDFVWSISDESVATITDDGMVTPVSEGYVDIIATSVDGSGVYGKITVEVNPAPKVRLDVTDVEARCGQEVLVDVMITENEGFASMRLEVDYDETKFTLVEVIDGGIVGKYNHSDKLAAPYVLSWENDEITENITTTGKIATLKFKVSEEAEEKAYPVTVTSAEVLDVDVNNVKTAIAAGYVDISTTLLGDVNGDGKISSIDRITLSRYLAKWDGYDETTIVAAASDVNNDRKITSMDRIVLSRYLAKWDGYETLPYSK